MIIFDGKTYLTPGEAVRELGIPSPTVYLWCRRGEVELLQGAGLKLFTGSKYLIELDSIRERARRLVCVS